MTVAPLRADEQAQDSETEVVAANLALKKLGSTLAKATDGSHGKAREATGLPSSPIASTQHQHHYGKKARDRRSKPSSRCSGRGNSAKKRSTSKAKNAANDQEKRVRVVSLKN